VFGTGTGGKENPTNARRRMLAPAVGKANEALGANRQEPLPERLTPHSLRGTFASLLSRSASRLLMSWPNSATRIRRSRWGSPPK
jgi:integrase